MLEELQKLEQVRCGKFCIVSLEALEQHIKHNVFLLSSLCSRGECSYLATRNQAQDEAAEPKEQQEAIEAQPTEK
jgi:hypothetical protein